MNLERAGIANADIGRIDAREIDGVAIGETGDRTGEMRNVIEHKRAAAVSGEMHDRVRSGNELHLAAIDHGSSAADDSRHRP